MGTTLYERGYALLDAGKKLPEIAAALGFDDVDALLAGTRMPKGTNIEAIREQALEVAKGGADADEVAFMYRVGLWLRDNPALTLWRLR